MGNEVKKRGGYRGLHEIYLAEMGGTFANQMATEAWVRERLEEIQMQFEKFLSCDEIIQATCEGTKVEAETTDASK